MFKAGLAYQKEMPINWCPSCKTGLANEEVVNGKCERCGADVTKKNLNQWMLKITAYADRLLDDLDKLDWPEKVKKMQTDWIGKSYGAEVNFKVENTDKEITVYTTRPDTLHGATFMVLAPEHAMAKELANDETRTAVEDYIYQSSLKSSVDRLQDKEKTGVFTGSYAINPINGAKVPIWLSDYVLADYGTGAIMCVPAHDDRDFEFATKFNIPIIQVIAKDGKEIEDMTEAYTDAKGTMINSGEWNGMESSVLKKEAPHIIEEMGIGKATTNYKLRDWVFSRQRYWGEPIPIIHCPDCGPVPVPEEELPLLLPEVESYQPTGTGESPLADITDWVNTTCPCCGKPAKRETNTMPQWAGSSWYFLRYTDPHNTHALADMDKLKYWMPVDWYNGGMEHVTRHMIYSRFWHHFLYDLGVVNTPEPYAKRSIQGLILGPDGDKMSKSKGNVVDPLDIVEEYGADTLRTYVLFMGDYGAATPWSENSVKGCKKFLDRVAGLTDILSEESVSDELEMKLHRTIKKVSSDIENLKFNTAIASLMTLINEITAEGHLSKDDLTIFIKLLSPFAPHVCEEIWEFIGGEGLLAVSEWPKYDEGKTIAKTVEIGVQVNGKVRGTIVIPNGCEKEKAFEIAKADERIASFLEGKNLIKEIYVPNKIVNFVAK